MGDTVDPRDYDDIARGEYLGEVEAGATQAKALEAIGRNISWLERMRASDDFVAAEALAKRRARDEDLADPEMLELLRGGARVSEVVKKLKVSRYRVAQCARRHGINMRRQNPWETATQHEVDYLLCLIRRGVRWPLAVRLAMPAISRAYRDRVTLSIADQILSALQLRVAGLESERVPEEDIAEIMEDSAPRLKVAQVGDGDQLAMRV